MSYISSKISKASLNNTKYFLPTSIEYEKNVHSVLTTQDNNMTEQQNYSYGLPVQNDIYQYRYNSFYKGSRDVDLMPTPYTTLDLPETKPSDTSDTSSIKSKALPTHVTENYTNTKTRQTVDDHETCGFEEDGVTNACGKDKQLYKIMDPKFNLREAAKNCILLEDHLTHSGKQCSDCIKKHCLMIEGFLEEGLTLDKEQKHKHEFDKCIKDFRGIFERLAAQIKDDTLTDDNCCKYAQEIRSFRKPLCQKYATFF
jgi:hypothetical protein